MNIKLWKESNKKIHQYVSYGHQGASTGQHDMTHIKIRGSNFEFLYGALLIILSSPIQVNVQSLKFRFTKIV